MGAIVTAGIRKGSSTFNDLPTDSVVYFDDEVALKAAGPFDGVADTVGRIISDKIFPHLKSGGTFASIVGPTPEAPAGMDVKVKSIRVQFDGPRLVRFAQDIVAARIKLPPATRLPLSAVGHAHTLLEAGGVSGKIVLVP